jgi:Protein of unknown function (DUF1573)
MCPRLPNASRAARWRFLHGALVVALAALACRPTTVPGAAPGPRLVCDASARDFGRVLEGDGLRHVFTLTNAGTSPAHITRVERSPSCVAGAVPPSIAPGASAGVAIDCASRGRAGKLADFVAVHSDDPSSPFRLQLRATIEPRLAFETNMIEIEVAPGERRSREIRLVGPLATRARIAVRSIDAGGPAAAILPAQGDRPAGLALTLVGDKVGVRVGRVLVSTGLDQPEELGLPYTMKVTGNVRVSPTNPTFNLRDPEARLQTLTVTSARADFRLLSADVVEGPFAAVVERGKGAGDGYAVRVSVVAARVAPGERGVIGKLVLVSNDPAESRKEVPLFGMGAIPPIGPH